ncbi:MAG: hypothetical protein LBJ31_06775 [Treponema sp.]|jgi:methyl-accepting chemotaxis protein|nr:hypothetical protein [Treponema sp.]
MEPGKYAELDQARGSLKFMVTLFFIFFFVAIFIVFIFTSVLQVNTLTEYICSQVGLPTLRQAAELVDGESFEKLTRTMDSGDPYYDKTRLALKELKERTGSRFIYTMAPKEGSVFFYIVDGGDPGETGFSELGDEEDIGEWDDAALATFRTGEVHVGALSIDPDWGWTLSAYGPIISGGETIGIVAVDLDSEPIMRYIRTQVFWQAAVVAAATLFGLLIYLLIRRRIGKLAPE